MSTNNTSTNNITDNKVSVIMPVYNREGLVERALLSAEKQTYPDMELICVDDGSTDNTLDILYHFQSHFSKCRIIAASHQGAVAALNVGIQEATGSYITFLDSDDEYDPQHIAARVEYMFVHPDIDLIHSSATLIGEEEDLLVPDKNNPGQLIHLKDCFIGATMFGKREIFEQVNGFREVFFYDSDLFERAKLIGTVQKIDLPTYRYYRNVKDSMLTQLKTSNNNQSSNSNPS